MIHQKMEHSVLFLHFGKLLDAVSMNNLPKATKVNITSQDKNAKVQA